MSGTGERQRERERETERERCVYIYTHIETAPEKVYYGLLPRNGSSTHKWTPISTPKYSSHHYRDPSKSSPNSETPPSGLGEGGGGGLYKPGHFRV